MGIRWPGPETDDVSVKDLLDFDALPWETRMLAQRVVKQQLAEDGWKEGDAPDADEEGDRIKELETENELMRSVLENIADGTVHIEDVVTAAKGALAA